MQYSTNSNEALRWLIQEKPTIAGAYRQARLQLEDRLQALALHENQKQKLKIQIQLKELEKQETECTPKGDLQAQLIELEIQEIKMGVEASDRLIADAVREAEFCRAEIDRLVKESGVDLPNLPADQFEALMDRDFAEGQYRWFAAQILGPQLGIPIEATERLLSLPQSERSKFLQLYEQKASEFLRSLGVKPLQALNNAAIKHN